MRFWPFTKRLPAPVQHLQAVTVKDDDVLVVTAAQILTVDQKKSLEKGLRDLGFPNKLVILDEGLTLATIRREA